MRLTVPDGGLAVLEGELADLFDQSATRLAGGVVEMICANDDKLEMVRRIARIGTPLDDIEIVQPSLDEMYAHFLRQEAAQ
jgi:Cu-processing system ATP-binding protein